MGWFDRFKKKNTDKPADPGKGSSDQIEKRSIETSTTAVVPQKTETSTSTAKERETKKTSEPSAKKSSRPMAATAFRIILRPHVTEKAARLQVMNQFIFEVPMDANKRQVAQAMLELYDARPTSVHVIKIPRKRVTQGRISGIRGERKKVIVTFAPGKTINVFQEV